MSKKVYDSKYTDKKVTAAQFLAELMIVRLAAKEKIKLEQKFWNDPKWSKQFKWQMTLANNLLKLYPEGAIIQAVSGKDLEWVFSLNTKVLLKKIEAISVLQTLEEEPPKVETTRRIDCKGQTLFDKI